MVTFTRYNLVNSADKKYLDALKILPKGTPCVIIHCKAYLGDQYSVEDYKNAVLSGQ